VRIAHYILSKVRIAHPTFENFRCALRTLHFSKVRIAHPTF